MATGVVESPIALMADGVAPALGATAARQPLAGTTHLQCGGCQASADHAQNEPAYGRLVGAFLGRHESCGNAVRITCLRGGHG